jgi:hypothetical protein
VSWTKLSRAGTSLNNACLLGLSTTAVACMLQDSICSPGCQIFLDTIYQNGEKYTKLPLNYQMAITYMYQMAVIYSKWPQNRYTNLFHSKTLQNLPK